MELNSMRSGSRKAAKNSPAPAIPWWFARREARRRQKVKGSAAPGLAAVLPSQVTGQRAPSCEQRPAKPVKRTAPWWFVKRESKRQGLKVAPKRAGPPSSNRGIQKSVREVVRAVLRPLLAEFRRALKFTTKSETREKAARPSFVSAGFMKGLKVAKSVPVSKPLYSQKKSSIAAVELAHKARSEQAVYKPSGAFAFDYGTYERNERSSSQWTALCGQLNNIGAQTMVAAAGTNPKVVLAANDVKVRNLILMYVKECGVDALIKRRHELDVIVGMHINPQVHINPTVKGWSVIGESRWTSLNFPETNALLKVLEDARPSEVLSLWFGENQKLAVRE